MKRRIHPMLAFIAFLVIATLGTDASWAQTRILRVGLLNREYQVPEPVYRSQEPFFRTLREHGWVEDKNVIFEFRGLGADPTRMAELAGELVRLKVDVLFAVGPTSVRAAFAATPDIPIVAHDLETDPVAAGYARSYSDPGGNLTGLFLDSPDLAGKWLQMLKAMVPRLSRVAVLWDTTSGRDPLDAVRKAALALGIKLQVLEIDTPADIDKAPSAFGGRAQAIVALPSPMMYSENVHLAKLAMKHRLPGTSMFVPFADAGGLLAYGPNMGATLEQCAVLLAKVLAGAKPGDLPIERPSKFEFVLNMKTARHMHLTVPNTVLLGANRLIN